MKRTPTPCPVSKVAALLSDTWTMLIMYQLLTAPKRFCELERELSGISSRTLTIKLKTLEKEGLVAKRIDGAYEATARGKGLRAVLSAMHAYEKRYL